MKIILDYIQKTYKGITLESLGVFLRYLGIYNVLFNPSYPIKVHKDNNLEITNLPNKNEFILKQLRQELEFHEHLWRTINRYTITSEGLLELIINLFNPNSHNANRLKENINKALKILNNDVNDEWIVKELIERFNKLRKRKEFSYAIRSRSISKDIDSFTSMVNEARRILEQMNKSPSIYTRSIEKKKQRDEILREEHNKKVKEELKPCTFRPLLRKKNRGSRKESVLLFNEK